MKDLKQSAKDYAEVTEVLNSVDSKLIEEAFLKGAEFVNTWISIEDELPEANKEEEIHGILYSEYISIKVRGYEHPFVGYYVKACDDEFFDFISESTSNSIKQVEITHWRPIL